MMRLVDPALVPLGVPMVPLLMVLLLVPEMLWHLHLVAPKPGPPVAPMPQRKRVKLRQLDTCLADLMISLAA
ncbi:hypothetical protein C0995_001069, partial [Termitomyces sp. Mi166